MRTLPKGGEIDTKNHTGIEIDTTKTEESTPTHYERLEARKLEKRLEFEQTEKQKNISETNSGKYEREVQNNLPVATFDSKGAPKFGEDWKPDRREFVKSQRFQKERYNRNFENRNIENRNFENRHNDSEDNRRRVFFYFFGDYFITKFFLPTYGL